LQNIDIRPIAVLQTGAVVDGGNGTDVFRFKNADRPVIGFWSGRDNWMSISSGMGRMKDLGQYPGVLFPAAH